MPARMPCPDSPSLRRLLAGRVPLPTPNRSAIISISATAARRSCATWTPTTGCPPPCGARRPARRPPNLRRSADGRPSPRRAAARRADGATAEDDGRRTALSDTIAPRGEADDAGRDRFDFLAPPEGPDELGRLGAYRVLKVLGAGGMGVVFQAEDPKLQRPVALKAMRPGLAASESARQRFLREARAAAAIEHDHIVPIYQVGEDRGVPFLAMPFLRGEPLDDRLKREARAAAGRGAAHRPGDRRWGWRRPTRRG